MIVHNREHLKKKTIRYEIFLMKYTILYIESLYQKKKIQPEPSQVSINFPVIQVIQKEQRTC